MQDLFIPYYNEITKEDMQMIISLNNKSRSTAFRFTYGCAIISSYGRNTLSIYKKLTSHNELLNKLCKKYGDDYHSPMLFKDGKGYIHALGERIDLDYSPDLDKQIENSKKHISKLLKKAVGPMIDKALKDLGIEGVTYKTSITSSISYVGQNSSKRMPGKIRKYSYTPEEIKGKEYILKFSWYLGLFNPKIIEAIVVHEVVHCLEQHHTKKFYSIVNNVCPNYDYLRKCIEKGYVNGVNNEL